uniref:Uncharacterized protein n=1 Tax=Lepeophtheirus salmonis TaxID=72036 RepID=A0A0K2UYQ5_LEPSM
MTSTKCQNFCADNMAFFGPKTCDHYLCGFEPVGLCCVGHFGEGD